MNKTKVILKGHDCISSKDAKKNGISKFEFYKYIKENGSEKIRRGFYSTNTDLVDELYIASEVSECCIFP